jgi:acyl carrier protein
MDEQEIRLRIRAVVTEMAPLQGEAVLPSARLVADLGFDSLGVMQCLGAVEQELELPDTGERGLEVETIEDMETLMVTALRELQADFCTTSGACRIPSDA